MRLFYGWVSWAVVFAMLITLQPFSVQASSADDGVEFTLAQSSLEEYKQQRQEAMQERREDFQEYLEKRSEAYQEFYEERQRKFEQFKKEIASKWGEYNVEVSTKKKMTSYSEDKTERSTVDFEEGKAEAEVLVDRETAEKNPEKVREKLRQEVKEMVTKDTIEDEVEDVKTEPEEPKKTPQKPESKQVPDRSEKQKPPTPTQPDRPDDESQPKTKSKQSTPDEKRKSEIDMGEPVLSDQVQTDQGEPVNEQNADEFAEEKTSDEKVNKDTVTGEDGEDRVKASVEIDLVPDHTEKRARKYLEHVKAEADRFDVQPEVLLAVMHTESSFNPKARSHIPAYGLMQLVPGSGGKAAYKHIYGEEKVLKPDYLYNPDNNVELGAGYLSLVYYQYLDGIENDRSRLYCAIASYNTGPGNLAKTFVDSMSVNQAEDVINSMSSEEVYQKLRRSLPYDETKKYIKKVRDRRERYDQWLNQVS